MDGDRATQLCISAHAVKFSWSRGSFATELRWNDKLRDDVCDVYGSIFRFLTLLRGKLLSLAHYKSLP